MADTRVHHLDFFQRRERGLLPRFSRHAVLVSDDPDLAAAFPELPVVSWSEPPSFLDFDTIIADLPARPVADDVVLDLGHALRAGSSVVILLGPSAVVETVGRLTDEIAFESLRAVSRESTVTSPSPRLLRYVAGLGQCHHVFAIGKGWTPDAWVKHPDLPVSVKRGRGAGNVLAILPGAEKLGQHAEALSALLFHAEKQTEKRPSVWGPLGAVTLLMGWLLAGLFFGVLASSVRIRTKPDDASFPSGGAWDLPNEARLMAGLTNEQLRNLNNLAPEDAPRQHFTLLRIVSHLDYSRQEQRFAAALASAGEHGEVEMQLEDLHGRFARSLGKPTTLTTYEFARRYVNLASSYASPAYLASHQRELGFATQVREMMDNGFVHFDREAVSQLLRLSMDSDTAIAAGTNSLLKAHVDPSIQPDVSYLSAALLARVLDHTNAIAAWQAFLEKNGETTKSDEARFNIITLQVKTLRTLANDRLLLEKAGAGVISDAILFADSFPRSYLADDALGLAFRVSFSLGHTESMYRAWARLTRQYRDSDTASILKSEFAKWGQTKFPQLSAGGGLLRVVAPEDIEAPSEQDSKFAQGVLLSWLSETKNRVTPYWSK